MFIVYQRAELDPSLDQLLYNVPGFCARQTHETKTRIGPQKLLQKLISPTKAATNFPMSRQTLI